VDCFSLPASDPNDEQFSHPDGDRDSPVATMIRRNRQYWDLSFLALRSDALVGRRRTLGDQVAT